MSIFIFLSHDVDWGRGGAPLSHILARRERFDEETIRNAARDNPYYNIPEFLEMEDKFGVRSTFFFRTNVKCSRHPPPPYNLEEYKSDIRSMLSEGWEVGLHSDPISIRDVKHLEREKKELENMAGIKIYGNRVHYFSNDMRLYPNLKKLGFKYDSSIMYCRDKIVEDAFGFFMKDGVIIFPVTFVEALAFTYLVRIEADVLKLFKQIIRTCLRQIQNKIITIIWHNCSLKMRYGRKYGEVLEYLTSLKNVYIRKGIELANMVEKGNLQ